MSKTINLAEHRPSPCENSIAVLEHALEEARSGELRGVVVIGDGLDNTTYRAAGAQDKVTLLGKIAMAMDAVMMIGRDGYE